jgi:hypothetical protein
MHVAVLLLYLNDFPRRTTFSRDWAERALTVVGDYYAAQSAGAVHLTWQVFDWLEMEIDEPAWLALSSTGIDDVVKAVQPRLPAGTDLLLRRHHARFLQLRGRGQLHAVHYRPRVRAPVRRIGRLRQRRPTVPEPLLRHGQHGMAVHL